MSSEINKVYKICGSNFSICSVEDSYSAKDFAYSHRSTHSFISQNVTEIISYEESNQNYNGEYKLVSKTVDIFLQNISK